MDFEEDKEVREIISKKLGISYNYKCNNYVGDHEIFNSQNFTLDDVKALKNININSTSFNEIYQKYIDYIINIIDRNTYMKVYVTADINENDNTINPNFNKDFIKENFEGFIKGEKPLDASNKIVLKTFLDLIKTYKLEDLLLEKDYIKKELSNGVFDIIKENENAFTAEERKKIDETSWNYDDVLNYKNLALLQKRLSYLKESNKVDSQKLDEMFSIINSLIKSDIPTTHEDCEHYSQQMSSLYKNYEILNRQDITANLYKSYGNKRIAKNEDIPSNMLLHFYGVGYKDILMTNFKNVIINRELAKEGKTRVATDRDESRNFPEYPELYEKYKKSIDAENLEDCLNELIPSTTFQITDEDISNGYGYRLDALQSNSTQLACTTATREELKNSPYFFAVGFGSDIDEKSILLSCDRNADSNVGIDNIPCKNRFEELSKTMHEITESKAKRKEILLKRENLKPAYFVCIYDLENLKGWKKYSENEIKALINEQIQNAKELGLDIIEIDLERIRENDKQRSNAVTTISEIENVPSVKTLKDVQSLGKESLNKQKDVDAKDEIVSFFKTQEKIYEEKFEKREKVQ